MSIQQSDRIEVTSGWDVGPSHSVWFLPAVLVVVLAAAVFAAGAGVSRATFSAGLFVSLVALGFVKPGDDDPLLKRI